MSLGRFPRVARCADRHEGVSCSVFNWPCGAIEVETMMKSSALCLSVSLLLAISVPATRAPAVDTEISRDAPDLSSVRAKIKAKDFKAALAELTPLLRTHDHADVYNLMGFSLRKTGDYKQAYTFYRKALDFDPEHKGALEYLGELYVETGQLDKAREHVVILKRLCPAGCEELTDLEAAIAGSARDNKW
jgi:tetratricopeptide (TPR) repeat protein